MERMQRRKRLKEFKRCWMKFLNAKFWEMAEGEEGGDKSRIKSACCQGRQALKSEPSVNLFDLLEANGYTFG